MKAHFPMIPSKKARRGSVLALRQICLFSIERKSQLYVFVEISLLKQLIYGLDKNSKVYDNQ